jgi:hypothetical protein
MWLFTPIGFFSATRHEVKDNPDRPEIQVRARAREDLENLIAGYFQPEDDTTIHEWKNRDYPYRVIVSQARWIEITAQLAAAIDYSNFKDEVKRVQGADRASVYSSVWGVMFDLEWKLHQMAKKIYARPLLDDAWFPGMHDVHPGDLPPDDDLAAAHAWLCHPEGEDCPDGCDVTADPSRLARYQASTDRPPAPKKRTFRRRGGK